MKVVLCHKEFDSNRWPKKANGYFLERALSSLLFSWLC